MYLPPLTIIDNDKHYKYFTKEKKKKIKGKKKEKKTIYQYLTDLKKDGLIVEAGRRITAGRSVTEILYAKKGFYMRKRDTDKKLQENEDWKKLVNVIGLAVQHHLQKKGFDKAPDASCRGQGQRQIPGNHNR